MDTQFSKWVDRTTGGASSREIARRLHKSHSTVLRWLNDGVPPSAAVEIATAYKDDVVLALAAAGWLKRKDIERARVGLGHVSTARLTEELHRRAKTAEKAHRSGQSR